MEHVETANHGRFVHEWELVDCPWNTTELGIHLDEYLGDDGSEVLASGDCAREDNL